LDRVVDAALDILDTEGQAGLSMRRLGQALNREAMSLYRYARNKGALLDGLVDRVLGDLHIDPDAVDWQQELHKIAREFRELTLAHPHVLPLLLTRPLDTALGQRPPRTLRHMEDFLTLLTRAGFTPAAALQAYRLFFAFLHGHMLEELQHLVEDPDQDIDLLRLGLHRLAPRQFPLLRSLASELAGYDAAHEFDIDIDLLITGIEARLFTPAPKKA
jgi:AcrR family transcriptional regulator